MSYRIRVAGCFLEYNKRFLILHRRADKTQGDTWGLPAGKVDPGETDKDAMLREIFEETGYEAKEDELKFLAEREWRFPEKTVEFVCFRILLKEPLKVEHNPDEHKEWRWVTAKECYEMKNLVHGFHDLLEWLGFVKV